MRIYVFFLFFFYIKWHKMREWASCSHKRKSSWQNKPLKSGPTPSATLNLSQSHRRPPAWGGGVTERPDSFPPTFTVKRPEWEKQLITLHLKEKLWLRPNMSKWKDRVVRWAKREPSFFSRYEPSFGRFQLLCFEHLSIFPSFAYHHTGSSIDWFPKVHCQFLFHSASAMCTLFIYDIFLSFAFSTITRTPTMRDLRCLHRPHRESAGMRCWGDSTTPLTEEGNIYI